MAQKFFKLHEAQELLLYIAPHLEQARELKQQMEKLDDELSRAAAQIMVLGGSIPPRTELAAKKSERDHAAGELKECVSKIVQTGCLVKDLETGLIDFPAKRLGEEVYLCWKLGEERIEYWHSVQEGFAGRRLLDENLLEDMPPDDTIIH